MSIKRYSSPCVKFTINVKVDGKQVPIVFDRFNHDDKRRFIEVDKRSIQEQMEKSKDFNVYFKLDFVIEDPKEKQLLEFRTNDLAKKWINKNHNIPYIRLGNRAMLDLEYGLLGFELQIETINK